MSQPAMLTPLEFQKISSLLSVLKMFDDTNRKLQQKIICHLDTLEDLSISSLQISRKWLKIYRLMQALFIVLSLSQV